MIFSYPYRFVQNFNRSSGHLKYKRLYTFKSTKSNQWYWVWVEYYDYNMYAIKFHLKAHRLSKRKYNLLSNTFEPRRIVFTCIQIMLSIYEEDDHASFGFIGANMEKEDVSDTKRFRFYRSIMATYFSERHFTHVETPAKSAYLMINKIELENHPTLLTDIQNVFLKEYAYFE